MRNLSTLDSEIIFSPTFVKRVAIGYDFNGYTRIQFIFSQVACTHMDKVRKTYVLKLYVAGNTPNSVRALKTLKEILEQEFQGVYALKVIDVLKNPQLAEEDKILATPTLSKILPPPVRKIIGDLSDRERVLIGLDLLYEELNEENYFSE